jgi:hypothetical protein
MRKDEMAFTWNVYRFSFRIIWFLYDTPADEKKNGNNEEKTPLAREDWSERREVTIYLCDTETKKVRNRC